MPIGRIGTDFIVNTTTVADQSEPTITALTDGRFVVTWRSLDTGDGSQGCIRGRILFPDGSPSGDDFIVNSTAELGQGSPVVAALADGRFVVTWESGDGADGSGFGVRARLFEPDGSPVGDDFIVNTTGAAAQFRSAVTVLADGRFMAMWQSNDNGDGAGSCVRDRLFEADGTPVNGGGDFIINSTTQGDQKDPTVTALSDGRFVATWESSDAGDGSGNCIRGRVFNGNGSPAADDFIVNTTALGDQADPAVTALASGRFIVTWSSADGGDGSGDCIRGRAFNADGSPDGNDFIINSIGPANQLRPSITALADGRFVAVWDSGGGDGSGFGIVARLFADNGNPIGEDFVVNTTLTNNQIAPTVTALADGRFVVTWQSADTGDGSGLTVRAQIFDPTVFFGTDAVTESWQGGELADRVYGGGGIDIVGGNGGNDILSGDAGNDLLSGDAGDDILRGGTGADNMAGGGDSDTYFVDNAGDVVVEANIAGIDTVNSSVTFNLAGQFIERLFLTGTGNINGTGNSLANTIRGTSGNNRLDGAGGADTMEGKGGDDTYIVNNAGDVVIEAANGGTDTVESSVSHTLSSFVENLELIDSADINGTGNDLANELTGNAGANRLDGLGGADTLRGLGGNDTYIVDNAADVVLEAAGQGTSDWVATRVSYALGAGAQVEILSTTASGGTAAINLSGNEIGQVITGNAGDNRVLSGGGTDTVRGLGGDDRFVFSSVFQTGQGATRDVILDFEDFGDNDTIDLSGFAGTLSFVGASGFTGLSQVRAFQVGADVLVQLNTTGNNNADGEILLKNTLLSQVTSSDFLL